MHRVLIASMREVATATGVAEVDAAGVFVNRSSNNGAVLMPSAVYGFCVQLTLEDKQTLVEEARNKRTCAVLNENEFQPISESIYPLYWGRDKMLGSRLYQHIKNTRLTGIVRLCAYAALDGREIGCAALIVTDSGTLEVALQERYPPLLRTVTRLL